MLLLMPKFASASAAAGSAKELCLPYSSAEDGTTRSGASEGSGKACFSMSENIISFRSTSGLKR